ncbi:MAG: STAS domain-containing protein [Bacteroidales bacterium]|nr:STAS domain-containing protein [Bacteroidales bacterium]MDD2613209.1 STAS domain-containing protein [Bacteroidales bacterium]MDD3907294.1 STAS domain-containing protein [Bacteroidales bacterium]
MNITKEKIGEFLVLTLYGRVDTNNFNELEQAIGQVFEADEKKIVLNCSGLNYISSSGLRIFLTALKKVNAMHGTLHLCSMQPVIKEIFDISGFSTIFQIFDTQKEALE